MQIESRNKCEAESFKTVDAENKKENGFLKVINIDNKNEGELRSPFCTPEMSNDMELNFNFDSMVMRTISGTSKQSLTDDKEKDKQIVKQMETDKEAAKEKTEEGKKEKFCDSVCGKELTSVISQNESIQQLSDKIAQLSQQLQQSVSQTRAEISQNCQTAQNKEQINQKAAEKFESGVATVHRDTRCANCHVTPIRGKRYRCFVCPALDFCEACERSEPHPHPVARLSTTHCDRQLTQVQDVQRMLVFGRNAAEKDSFKKVRLLKTLAGDKLTKDFCSTFVEERKNLSLQEFAIEVYRIFGDPQAVELISTMLVGGSRRSK